MPVSTLSATQQVRTAATAASAAEPPAASIRRPTSAVAGWPAAIPAGTRVASFVPGVDGTRDRERPRDDRTGRAGAVGGLAAESWGASTERVTGGSVDPPSQFPVPMDSIRGPWPRPVHPPFTQPAYSPAGYGSVIRSG